MMNQVASQTEIGKICSKRSPCSASRLSRPADTPSGALSHGQDPQLPWASRHPQTRLTLPRPVLIRSFADTGGRVLACSAALGGKHPCDLQLSSTGPPNSCGGRG